MSSVAPRKLKPSSRAHGRLATVILVVVAAGLLLAVPATASAHVNAKHKKAYKATIEGIGKMYMEQETAFDKAESRLNQIEAQMEPLIGSTDPDQQAQLASLKAEAGIENLYLKSWEQGEKPLAEEIHGIGLSMLPWFKAMADKRLLVKGTKGVETVFHQLGGDGFSMLAAAATDLQKANLEIGYTNHIGLADRGKAEARKTWTHAMTELGSLI
jgi:hypothetical protein